VVIDAPKEFLQTARDETPPPPKAE